jgi:hypothetical protein
MALEFIIAAYKEGSNQLQHALANGPLAGQGFIRG